MVHLAVAAALAVALAADAPASPTARLVAAEAQLLRGQPEQAQAELAGLAAQLPEVADWVHLLAARAARQRLDWQAASVAYQAVLGRVPRSPFAQEAALGLADGHFARGQDAAARLHYLRALRLSPQGPGGSKRALLGRTNLATLLQRQGATRAAAKQLREVARRDADGELALLAVLQRQAFSAPRGAFAAAAERLELLLPKRHLELAVAALAEATPLATEPAQRDRLQDAAAQIKLRQRDFAAAIALWTPLLARTRGDAHLEVGRSLAGALSQAQQNHAAILIWSELAAYAPHARAGRDAAYRAAWLTYNAGEMAQAHRLFGRLLEAHPHDPQSSEATWLWAWTAYRSGQFEAASFAFDRLARRLHRSSDPERSGRLHYWRAQTYLKLSEVALARASFGRAAQAPWTYYGLLARARLAALPGPVQSFASMGELVAAAAPDPPPSAAALPDPPPPPPGPTATATPPDWECGAGAALDWHGAVGRRLSVFLAVGQTQLASRLVSQLPRRPGGRDLAASRAHALAALGDAGATYRLATLAFARQLAGPLDAASASRFKWAYPAAHLPAVQAAVADFGGSTALVLAIMRQESGFDSAAHSSADARGLMQVIPATGREIAAALQVRAYDDDQLAAPLLNVRFGSWYLARLQREFCGSLVAAIASYNAGPQAVKTWLSAAAASSEADVFVEDIPFRQTRNYVKQVLANYAVYARLYGSEDAQASPPLQVGPRWRGEINF